MKQIAVIIQPMYLPWLGYFDLVDQSSVFVFLDNVQFEKRSWQQRNRIRTSRGLEWLTIPVHVKGRFDQLIKDVEIMPSKIFPRGHLRAIALNYRRARFFDKYYPKLEEILQAAPNSLCELNIRLVKWLSSVLGIETRFEAASALGAQGKRSSLLADACNKVGAEMYLSPYGSKDYLIREYKEFESRGIEVLLHGYDHPEYRQVYAPFVPYASVLDLIFNEGDRSVEIVRSGRKESSRLFS